VTLKDEFMRIWGIRWGGQMDDRSRKNDTTEEAEVFSALTPEHYNSYYRNSKGIRNKE
jgi:hypothetical protein